MTLTYQQYYDKCREVKDFCGESMIDKVNMHINYSSGLNFGMVKELGAKVDYKIRNKLGTISDKFAIKLEDIWDIEEIFTIGKFLNSIAENDIYCCYSIIEHIHVYENVPTKEPVDSSWKWHYDDCAPHQFKVMIYLTDVEVGNGEMVYLVGSNGQGIRFKSSRIAPNRSTAQVFRKSRIPIEFIQSTIDKGGSVIPIVGPVGTNILFSQNCAHKASVPTKEPYRQVIIYNFRPFHKEIDPIDRSHTYSWACPHSVKQFSTKIS